MSSNDIYTAIPVASQDAFKPTYLCIKKHSVTGLNYFCKTTKSHDKMLSYKGSGRYWTRHLKVHGKEHVETVWYCLFYNRDEIVKFALQCSEQWDIVNSKEWANEKPENGVEGGSAKGKQRKKGRIPWNKGLKTGPKPAEQRERISKKLKGTRTGSENPMYGKSQSAEHVEKRSKSMMGKNKGRKLGPNSPELIERKAAGHRGKTYKKRAECQGLTP